MSYVSADCKEVKDTLKIKVTSLLPAKHGSTITYRCASKHTKRGGNVVPTCFDGNISFPDGSTPCFKIGTDNKMFFVWTSVQLENARTLSSLGKS